MKSQAGAAQAAEDALVASIVDLGPEREFVTADATWDELQIDSLDMMELLQSIQDRIGLELQPEEFEGIDTVGAAIEYLRRRVS